MPPPSQKRFGTHLTTPGTGIRFSHLCLSKAESIEEIKRWLKTASLDPITKTPQWVYGNRSIGGDTGTITANIAKYITAGGKFKPDPKGGLVQTKTDLEALQKLYGSSKNAQTSIVNTMTDLGGIAARDNFYNTLKNTIGQNFNRRTKSCCLRKISL